MALSSVEVPICAYVYIPLSLRGRTGLAGFIASRAHGSVLWSDSPVQHRGLHCPYGSSRTLLSWSYTFAVFQGNHQERNSDINRMQLSRIVATTRCDAPCKREAQTQTSSLSTLTRIPGFLKNANARRQFTSENFAEKVFSCRYFRLTFICHAFYQADLRNERHKQALRFFNELEIIFPSVAHVLNMLTIWRGLVL